MAQSLGDRHVAGMGFVLLLLAVELRLKCGPFIVVSQSASWGQSVSILRTTKPRMTAGMPQTM